MLKVSDVGRAKTLNPRVCLGTIPGRFFDVKLLRELKESHSPMPVPITFPLSPRIQRLEAMEPGAGLIFAASKIGALNGLSLHQGQENPLTDVRKRLDALGISAKRINFNLINLAMESFGELPLKARDEDYPRSRWLNRRLPLVVATKALIILGRIGSPKVFEPVTGTPEQLIRRAKQKNFDFEPEQLNAVLSALSLRYAEIQEPSLRGQRFVDANCLDGGNFIGRAELLEPEAIHALKVKRLCPLLEEEEFDILSSEHISFATGMILGFVGRNNAAGLVDYLIGISQMLTSDPKIQDEFFVRVLATLGVVKYQRPVQNDFLDLTGQSTRIITEQLTEALEKLTSFLRERLSESGPEQPDLFRQQPEGSGTTPAPSEPPETTLS